MAKVLEFPMFEEVQELRKQARESNRNAVGCNPIIIKTTDATYVEVDAEDTGLGVEIRLYIAGLDQYIIDVYFDELTALTYDAAILNLQISYNNFVEKL